MRTLRWMALPLLAALAAMSGGCAKPGGPGDVPTPPTSTSPSSTPPSSTPPGTSPGPGSGALPPTTVTRRGGLAGVDETVAITADGSWVYTNRRQVTSQRGTLTDAQRTSLVQLVTSPNFLKEAKASPGTSHCNDAFMYSITVGDLHVQYEDCGNDRPAVMAVVTSVVNATPL
jgi:hypothetical protein